MVDYQPNNTQATKVLIWLMLFEFRTWSEPDLKNTLRMDLENTHSQTTIGGFWKSPQADLALTAQWI